jgi:hypothetical protein
MSDAGESKKETYFKQLPRSRKNAVSNQGAGIPEATDNIAFRVYDPDVEDDDDLSTSIYQDSDVESDNGDAPVITDAKFEFTDSYKLFRLLKMLLFMQVLALIIDNPAVKIATLFDIISKGLLYYSLRFYSRPFIDLVSLVQYLIGVVAGLAGGQQSDKNAPDRIEITSRRNLQADIYNISSIR